MKLIFLDFDGVLINSFSFRGDGRGSGNRALPPESTVTALNHIVDATGANIVVTSTWRYGQRVVQLRELLSGWGVRASVIGATPDLRDRLGQQTRGAEIRAWLEEWSDWRDAPERFVILDDDQDMGDLVPHLVRTSYEAGLQMSDAERAITALIG